MGEKLENYSGQCRHEISSALSRIERERESENEDLEIYLFMLEAAGREIGI